ncbi:hypothetical protein WK24_15200 [Burkholderia vietnamiensis]|uniref:hypothetical protein n=1 Tax=Burkholderia cepacia complex TaxID=87882 RepID=UPI0007525847|nr:MULTISPECIES: hypothetical protein [Burkholderia cepacia complex]KVR67313.1 hypothetical protein WK24_15200 [Burkholderia vietnamiensis]MCA7919418.1 hypothetical protein [Burkholderia contaminans]UUX37162.1 hypothetical protein NTJ56_17755 [Burkholderia contaminans]
MQTAEIRTRTEFRFVGHNDVVYGRGPTLVEAVRDAEGFIGEPMMTQAAIDENGYIVEVEQEFKPFDIEAPVLGEWVDVK